MTRVKGRSEWLDLVDEVVHFHLRQRYCFRLTYSSCIAVKRIESELQSLKQRHEITRNPVKICLRR